MNSLAKNNLLGNARSATDVWATPQDLFDKLNEVFRFDIDVCAIPENAKCKVFFSPEINGLEQKWEGTCFMNPPYSREISQWVKKAHESALTGSTVVAVLPVRTSTRWWQDYCSKQEIHYIKGRLKFGGVSSNAPFCCAVIVFRPNLQFVDWES